MPPLPPGATEIEGSDSDVMQRIQSWRLWIWFEGKGELRAWLVVEKLRGATEEEGEVEVENQRELRDGFGELLLLEKRLIEEDEGWRLDVHNDMSESWNTSLRQR